MQFPLLRDKAIGEFITHGYLLTQADLGSDFHRSVCDQIDNILEKEGNPGNNLLPRLPEIQQVFDHPNISGVLTSLLGPDYAMHPHRYCHLNPAGSEEQNWHKDDYVYDQKARHHRCRWIMALYYPQEVTADMGPTAIIPGRQCYNQLSSPIPVYTTETALPLCGPAGTVAFVNFDTWHRATANHSDRNRYMLKFQFLRMREPRQSSWSSNHNGHTKVTTDLQPGLSHHLWNWLSGSDDNATKCATEQLTASDQVNLTRSMNELRGQDETSRLRATYELGAAGERSVAPLTDALRNEAARAKATNLDPSPANPQGSNPAELDCARALSAAGRAAVGPMTGELNHASWVVRAAAADILGNLGLIASDATSALCRTLCDQNPWVRRNAAEALGYIEETESIGALTNRLTDDDWRVRLNSSLSLARLGTPAAIAISQLKSRLRDPNRYVRYNATLALHRIGTDASRDILWNELQATRWCALTTHASPY